jgi:hypothetical protein
MVDYIFYILLALTAMQPGHGDLQVELYSDGQLQYRAVAQTNDSGYTLSVVNSALELRQVALLERDKKGFKVWDEGAEESRRIDLFEDIPEWTPQATSGKNFSVSVGGAPIHGARSGEKLTISMDSDIDTVVVQPRP